MGLFRLPEAAKDCDPLSGLDFLNKLTIFPRNRISIHDLVGEYSTSQEDI